MVKAKNKKLKSKKTKDKKMNTKTITLPKKNIETKIDAKSGKASGNVIKNNPATSNSSSARPQRNIEIKIEFISENKMQSLNGSFGPKLTLNSLSTWYCLNPNSTNSSI